MNKYKTIYNRIKKYDSIVIARHIGADPDALASQIGLKELILTNFKNKKVYAVGNPASKFKFMGVLDRFDESLYENSLLIVTDTPDIKRIDGVDYKRFKEVIKIDHHPFIEKYADIELIDDNASSASQIVLEFLFDRKLNIEKETAEKLYMGIIADTGRFLFNYTSTKTFDLVSKLIKKTGIDFTKTYDNLYLKPIKEVRFQGFIETNMNVTENGVGYLKITEDMINEYGVDSATAGNMVNNFNYIEEVLVWGMFSIDKANNTIRASIRSRGPIINEIASHFGGGGHALAAGARLKDFDEVDLLIKELDEQCLKYKNL